MTVKELINLLKEAPPEAVVVIDYREDDYYMDIIETYQALDDVFVIKTY